MPSVAYGGTLTWTVLDQVVTPALFFKFGRKVYEHKQRDSNSIEPSSPSIPISMPTPPPAVQSVVNPTPQQPPVIVGEVPTSTPKQ